MDAALRRHRGRRRPCRLRGRGCGRPHGRAHGAGDPSIRDHRRDVLQSGDRRARQGPSGARDRCARWPDGPRRRSRRHPVPRAQSPQGPGGARPARPGRPQALCRGDAAGDPRDRESHRRDRSRGGRSGDRGRPRRRARSTDGRDVRRRRRGADHRHVSARPHPYRRAANAGRPGRRGAGARAFATLERLGFCARPAQDRHAAAARRPHHRLGGGGNAARRRAAGAVFRR